MTINKDLRQEIQKKLGKTPRRVNQIINEFASERKIMDRDVAAYAYAYDVFKINIKLKKFLINEKRRPTRKC